MRTVSQSQEVVIRTSSIQKMKFIISYPSYSFTAKPVTEGTLKTNKNFSTVRFYIYKQKTIHFKMYNQTYPSFNFEMSIL